MASKNASLWSLVVMMVSICSMLVAVARLVDQELSARHKFEAMTLTASNHSLDVSLVKEASILGIRIQKGNDELPKLVNSSGREIIGRSEVLGAVAAGQTLLWKTVSGRIAATILLSSAILVTLFRDVCAKYLVLIFVPAILSLGGLAPYCVTCTTGSIRWSAYAPVIAFVVTILSFFWVRSEHLSRYRHILLVGLALVPVGQSVLLIQDPKLCWACVISGASMLGVISGLSEALRAGEKAVVIPGELGIGAFGVLLLLRSMLVTFGVLGEPQMSTVEVSDLTGKNVRELIREPIPDSRIYYVTSSGCPACAAARVGFATLGVHAEAVPVCAKLSDRACFEQPSEALPTPAVFGVDADGVVKWQFVGWPPPQEAMNYLSDSEVKK